MTIRLKPAMVFRRVARWCYPSFLLIALVIPSLGSADTVYLEPEQFLNEVFDGQKPEPKVLWIAGELRADASKILGHKPPSLRTRYWSNEKQSAWILEEIGKDLPITVGLVVEQGKLKQVRVLIFRESRGWEVHNPAFVKQYSGASLTDKAKLDRHIDGITGATLSVRALNKLARLALRYDNAIQQP